MIFAVSMDYTVFLLSAAKEHRDHTHDARRAMVGAVAHSGRVIFAAGAVMVAVFFTFALSGPLPPKEMGIILGVAVLLDAAMIRLLLLPVLLRLMGTGRGTCRAGHTRRFPGSPSDTHEEGGTLMSRRPLELWQTEWCPASHRVRQRLTELGVSYVARQVPVQREARTELRLLTGEPDIPVLLADRQVVSGEQAILTYLNEHFNEAPDAADQRAKAAKAKQKELEAACPKLAAATH